MTDHPYRSCLTCTRYTLARMSVLAPEFAAVKRRTGEDTKVIMDRYFDGVHQRHLAGLPVLDDTSRVRQIADHHHAALIATVNQAGHRP